MWEVANKMFTVDEKNGVEDLTIIGEFPLVMQDFPENADIVL